MTYNGLLLLQKLIASSSLQLFVNGRMMVVVVMMNVGICVVVRVSSVPAFADGGGALASFFCSLEWL